MSTLKPLRLLGAASALSLFALAAVAQTTPPAPSAEKPPLAKPEAAPGTQNMPGSATDVPKAPKAAAAPTPQLVGLSAFSSDGNKTGDGRAV